MTTPNALVPLQSAGAVDIELLAIVTTDGKYNSVKDYLSELNIYEDIFSNFVHGNIQLSDSTNLIKEMPIVGDEYLVMKIRTPTLDSYIYKMFRIFAVSDRAIVTDLNTQLYTLHFVSKEAVLDTLTPLYKSFSGKIDDVVKRIYDDYLKTQRTLEAGGETLKLSTYSTALEIFTKTENSIKFVSPGWTPFKCINFCASKAIPKEGKACNFLFFETNKKFYFGSVESIFDLNNITGGLTLGKYNYAPNNVAGGTDDLNEKMFQVEQFDVVKTADHLQNYSNGYLANRLITLDVVNKKYEFHDYDHVEKFKTYQHSQGTKSIPIFANETPRNPLTSIRFYPIHPGLHTLEKNINERMPDIYGNRMSNMMELANFKLNLTVPGRTDAEVGAMIYFSFPDVSPKASSDTTKTNEDKYYSGNYIITALRHKINLYKHTMTMEIVKDALNSAK